MAIRIEFFHDVVCGWCYIQSPILRKIQEKYNVEVIHRCFVLQRTPQEMAVRFGSLNNAKKEILRHWESCQKFEGSVGRFNIEGMNKASFSYPSGMLAAQACKASDRLAGPSAHWDMFDALQRAHLQRAENIGDLDVVLKTAVQLGFDSNEFLKAMYDLSTFESIEEDNRWARELDIQTIPAFSVNGDEVFRSTTRYEALDAYFGILTVT
ncbi:DsbA family protein [Vibrio fortis]|uniref:DsbA family oxidoreductase n=1 Tax=Vibrio fortis TaxID=212667 RepID=UPI0036F34869